MATVAADEIIKLEKQYWQALVDRDFQKARDLTSDPCIVAGAQGVAKLTRKQFDQMMSAGSNWTVEKYELSDVSVVELDENVAGIGYKVRMEMTVDGKPLTMEAADTSTWLRKNGTWTCTLHTESVLGDPFGRDRKAS